MAEKEVKGIKKFFEEFKAFAMRGNVLDMAVGVVIGGAFTAIVNSLVNDIINPSIGLFLRRRHPCGRCDDRHWFLHQCHH